jgi:hypothetical protein
MNSETSPAYAAKQHSRQVIIVFQPNFMIGSRRRVQANAYHLVATVRLCLVGFDSAAELYNFSVQRGWNWVRRLPYPNRFNDRFALF